MSCSLPNSAVKHGGKSSSLVQSGGLGDLTFLSSVGVQVLIQKSI